ncbi:hypothetical protein DFH28DRAFT_1135435 [Melampsora americana]|nr:hypothetical protein DFH28DRAFT_1135435 [Melampsora americana]
MSDQVHVIMTELENWTEVGHFLTGIASTDKSSSLVIVDLTQTVNKACHNLRASPVDYGLLELRLWLKTHHQADWGPPFSACLKTAQRATKTDLQHPLLASQHANSGLTRPARLAGTYICRRELQTDNPRDCHPPPPLFINVAMDPSDVPNPANIPKFLAWLFEGDSNDKQAAAASWFSSPKVQKEVDKKPCRHTPRHRLLAHHIIFQQYFAPDHTYADEQFCRRY